MPANNHSTRIARNEQRTRKFTNEKDPRRILYQLGHACTKYVWRAPDLPAREALCRRFLHAVADVLDGKICNDRAQVDAALHWQELNLERKADRLRILKLNLRGSDFQRVICNEVEFVLAGERGGRPWKYENIQEAFDAEIRERLTAMRKSGHTDINLRTIIDIVARNPDATLEFDESVLARWSGTERKAGFARIAALRSQALSEKDAIVTFVNGKVEVTRLKG